MLVFLFFICILLFWLIYKLFWLIYKGVYYNSTKFKYLKTQMMQYVDECNKLNRHIEQLKDIKLVNNSYYDSNMNLSLNNGNYNYGRKYLRNYSSSKNVYNCSLSVFKNAREQPFKYICKYFNIESTDENLNKFEDAFNNFSAVEQGKQLLLQYKSQLFTDFSSQIPVLILKFDKKNLENRLDFTPVNISTSYYPVYEFRYTSAGGNSGQSFQIIFDLNTLESFIQFLSDNIKHSKSKKYQRQLMTSKLRENIKRRDNYTCKKCGASIQDEPHLLLEIDHIIPVSKGGLTTEDNLQTLCWKCNRLKGSKIEY